MKTKLKIQNYLVVLLIIFASCRLHSIPEPIKKNLDSVVNVVLLAGQSNMVGFGNYDDLSEELKDRIAKVADRVTVSYTYLNQVPLSYSKNKPNEKYSFTKRFGPELFIGLTLAEKYPNKEFLLIKHAKGGTSLYGAWSSDYTLEKAKEIEKGEKKQGWNLPQIHINLINKNLNILKEKGKDYKIIGMAWMQGENDALKEFAATSYAENLQKLIEKYRTTFNEENMPFVFGQINSRYGIKGGPAIVRSQMEKVPTMVQNTAILKTTTDKTWSDYPKHKDNVHYNAEGQKRLGIAFANELIKMINE
ncbi:sialate O-acetylesterase [Aquimarina sp. ERC-38]|uniref:sialate O-acetylesterase n=1 Tax=Aquimarina sp. ERC-38 TaxID=2949996 RepID=UPI002246B011|nr:sialate O-acetylesterase [Aquimarina sp. ERC-38]UZO82236.1 sialate O-acetylesterase [Aquimarina sp. ERC-38]